jgi:CHAT domain-containing protein
LLMASERYSHPYFWAPFVMVGQMNVDQRAKR